MYVKKYTSRAHNYFIFFFNYIDRIKWEKNKYVYFKIMRNNGDKCRKLSYYNAQVCG